MTRATTLTDGLVQPFAVAVTVRLDTTAVLEELDVAVKFVGFDVPLAGIPVAVLSFVQLYVTG